MKKLLATTAFVALMAASGSAFSVDETNIGPVQIKLTSR